MNAQQLIVEHGLAVKSVEVLRDLAEEEYHRSSGLKPDQWVTRSMLKDWIESPAGFKLRHVDNSMWAERKGSKSMELGTYFDVLATEGTASFIRKFPRPEYREIPDHWRIPSGISKKREVRREIKDRMEKGHIFKEIPETVRHWQNSLQPGQTVRNDKLADKAAFLLRQMNTNPLACHLLDTAEFQITIRAELECGLRVQVRPDFWNPHLNCLGDIKTSAADESHWMKDAVKYGYHIQDALYTYLAVASGMQVDYYQFVVQQTEMPYQPYVVGMPDEVREWAFLKTMQALAGITNQEYGQPQKQTRIPWVQYWLKNQIDDDMSTGGQA